MCDAICTGSLKFLVVEYNIFQINSMKWNVSTLQCKYVFGKGAELTCLAHSVVLESVMHALKVITK